MIRTYHRSNWIPFTNVNAEAAVQPYSVDLAQLHPAPDEIQVGIEVMTGDVAPGATKNFTTHYAVTSSLDSPAALANISDTQAANLPNASQSRTFLQTAFLPRIGRYLWLWFDHDALAASSSFQIRITVTGRWENN